ncbi:hypothetical protein HDA30_001396 [Micrococcus cohnii]|uniref:DUF3073 domain-containing protein n=2 Tax=Micrococcus cohnii TaxID=993416 RepID=A0A7W7M3T6_9MICC|nr:hypothetical protein [Micrococcus cohnii]
MKYFTPGTDLSALERELAAKRARNDSSGSSYEDPTYEDPYADLYADEDEDDGADRR